MRTAMLQESRIVRDLIRKGSRMRTLALAMFAAAMLLYGCQTTVDSPRTRVGSSQSGQPVGSIVVSPTGNGDTGSESVHTFVDARPAALMDGKPVLWGELRPLLNDLAGAEALQEVLLDRRLDQELKNAGIIIGEDAINA